MPSKAAIASEIMVEFGKSDSQTAARVEQKVGDITIDLLSQNQGRFKGLEKTQSISIESGTSEYKLNTDFNSAKEQFYEVNSSGIVVAECTLTTSREINRRIVEGETVTHRMCFIKYYDSHDSGKGVYLVLAEEPTESATYEFEYYRKPTVEDTDIIRNTEIIKLGTRAGFPEFNPKAAYELGIYERRKEGFKEEPEKYNPKMVVKPSRRTSKFNRIMRTIGGGS